MSTPRPSEADVEALAEAVHRAFHDHWNPSKSLNLYPDSPLWDALARAVLASDWLAARDAEHKREAVGVAAIGRVLDLDGQVQQARLRAEAAERALADLRGEIKALAFSLDRGDSIDRSIAANLRALLPRDDAAGAGGAS